MGKLVQAVGTRLIASIQFIAFARLIVSAQAGFINGVQFWQQDLIKREAIKNDVVQAQEQAMISVAQSYQQRAQQRPFDEIKGPPRHCCRLTNGLSLPLRHMRQIQQRQRDRLIGMDLLSRLSIEHRKGRAPGFMTPDNLVQALLQRGNCKSAGQVDSDTLVVNRRISYQLGEHPELLLPEREGKGHARSPFGDSLLYSFGLS